MKDTRESIDAGVEGQNGPDRVRDAVNFNQQLQAASCFLQEAAARDAETSPIQLSNWPGKNLERNKVALLQEYFCREETGLPGLRWKLCKSFASFGQLKEEYVPEDSTVLCFF